VKPAEVVIPLVAAAPVAPPPAETPGHRLKRLAAEAAAQRATARQQAQTINDAARAYLDAFDYAAAVQVYESFNPEQAEHRDDPRFAEARQKRDRVDTLTHDIGHLVEKGKFLDPRLPLWVRQYIALDPTDMAMAELATELPPPNDPPANPQPGDRYTDRVSIPDLDTKPGQLMTLKVSIPDPKVKPGTLSMLKWNTVPKRANPNPTK